MTAVEWLVSQLNKQGFAQVITDEEIEQAKEIEKQQIIDAYWDGVDNFGYGNKTTPKEYYNETFKNTNK